MRGADLESTPVLLEHVRKRLAVIEHELAAATDAGAPEDTLWAVSADLTALRGVVEVLLARETLSRLRRAGG